MDEQARSRLVESIPPQVTRLRQSGAGRDADAAPDERGGGVRQCAGLL